MGERVTTRQPLRAGTPWWRDAVGYEVYLRSFSDSDGDGIGDLAGLIARLDHLAALGVDVVWVTPFYPSPMADFGYDVADYRDVDPRFGTLADVDRLVEAVHARDMRLIIDLVPNHTSDQHEWFRSSRRSRTSPHRDRYIWRDPAPDGGPPNNWRSHFGGPAWTFDDATGQYYLHLFLPEQPDLNWADPEVRDAFRDILRFWLDRGVDGFRIDVAQALVKDPELRDNPVDDGVPATAPPRTWFKAMRHDHDIDQPGNREIYRDWKSISGERGAALLGEVYLDDAEAVGRYVGGDGLDLAFYFPGLHTTWDAGALRTVVEDALRWGRGRFVWVHSSHDDSRAPTRFGGGVAGRTRALALLAFTAFLPGPLFLYQGDELGLVDGVVPAGDEADPVAVRNADHSDGRDPVRTPMPWSPGRANLGFSSGTPWLPVGTNRVDADAVDAQAADPDSHLHRVRHLLEVRRRLLPLPETATPIGGLDDRVLAVRRGDLDVYLAVGAEARVPPEIVGGGSVALSFGGAAMGGPDRALHLPADSVAVVVR